jgi:hypothetical protein
MNKVFICVGVIITVFIPLLASTMTFDSKTDYFLLVFTVTALDWLCFLAHKIINENTEKNDES